MALKVFQALDKGGIKALWEDIVAEISTASRQLTTWANNTFVKSVNGKTGSDIQLTKSDIGLGNVNNTADVDKHVAHAETASNADTVDGKHASDFASKDEFNVLENVTATAISDLGNKKIDKDDAKVSVVSAGAYAFRVTQGGSAVGLEISFASLVQEGLIKKGGTESHPTDWEYVDPVTEERKEYRAGTYIYLQLNNNPSDPDNGTKIYINASDLIKQYTEKDTATIDMHIENNEISADVQPNSINETHLATAITDDIALGVAANDAVTNTSTGLATKSSIADTGYRIVFENDPTDNKKKLFLKNQSGDKLGNGVEISVDSYINGDGILFSEKDPNTGKTTISVDATFVEGKLTTIKEDVSTVKGLLGGHSVGETVPSGAVFTDTMYKFEGYDAEAESRGEDVILDGIKVTTYDGSSISSETIAIKVTEVNGHTVEKNVPANAVFTDSHDTNVSGTGITVSGERGQTISLSQDTQNILADAAADHNRLNGHSVGANVPTDLGDVISNAKSDHENLGGHTIGTNVPENAVFTDYQTTLEGHYNPNTASVAQKLNPNETGFNVTRDMPFIGGLSRDSKNHVISGDTYAVVALTDQEIHDAVFEASRAIASRQ